MSTSTLIRDESTEKPKRHQPAGEKYQAWVGPNPDQPDVFDLKTPITNARYLVLNTSGDYPTELELYEDSASQR